MSINLNGVTIQNCPTKYGDYVIDFYPINHTRKEVRDKIPDTYEISHTEYIENGELLIWFIKQK